MVLTAFGRLRNFCSQIKRSNNETIIFIEYEKLVSEEMSLANVLNERYVRVTRDVGKPDCRAPDYKIDNIIK